MRDIKFRGLSVNGAMVFGYLIKDLPHSTNYYDEYPYRICWHPKTGGETNCPVKAETVGQFTGLKDLNGADIYEGDIVKWGNPGNEEIETVYYSQASCAFETEMLWLMPGEFVVIGNIHQNPELINEAKS